MMKKRSLSVLIVLGTRPEVIKMFPVVDALRRREGWTRTVVSTSQHRELIDDLFALFSMEPDHELDVIRPNQSLAKLSAAIMTRLAPILRATRPDLVLVQGDTTTAMVGALTAFYQEIPVGHVEAGLRSFNQREPHPEEVNRKMISALAELHFAPTRSNAQNLLSEQVDPESIYLTGNPGVDTLELMKDWPTGGLGEVMPDVPLGESRRLILVTAHRRENHGRPLENLCKALVEIAALFPDVDIVYPVHPNPNVRGTVHSLLSGRDRIHLLEPLSYDLQIEAMRRAELVITDSGGIQEEAPSLGTPVLVFREVTERQEGVETQGVRLVGTCGSRLFRNAVHLLSDTVELKTIRKAINPYGDGRAAKRILAAISHHFLGTERSSDFSPTQPETTRYLECQPRPLEPARL